MELDAVIRTFHLSWSDIQIHQINETLAESEQSDTKWDNTNPHSLDMHPPEPQ